MNEATFREVVGRYLNKPAFVGMDGGDLEDIFNLVEDLLEEEAPYKVVIRASSVKHDFAECETEEEAEDLCEYYDWRWIDENGFEWSMEIEET